MSESIRYASGDPIESWLNNLLCLDVSNAIPNLSRLDQSTFHISFESETILSISIYCFSPENRLPPPSECDLYYVNRDTLFSYHRDSELFLQVKSDIWLCRVACGLYFHVFKFCSKNILLLQRMMALYVASHYKNSPNDLQLMADAPAHHLFVLLGKLDFLSMYSSFVPRLN